MFQHYRSVSSTFTSATNSLTLGTMSFSQSLCCAQISLSRVNPYFSYVWVSACIVIHPFCAGMGFSVHSSINKTFFFSKASSTFFFCWVMERSFFSGTYFACEDEFSNANDQLKFKCLLPFQTLAGDITKMATRLDVYKFCYAHAHFQDCTNHDTQNIIL